MTALTWCLLALAAAGMAFGIWQWSARRHTLQRGTRYGIQHVHRDRLHAQPAHRQRQVYAILHRLAHADNPARTNLHPHLLRGTNRLYLLL